MTLTEALEIIHERVVTINWYVFGFVLLFVGLFAITDALVWFILSIPALWLFGLVSAGVIAGRFLKRAAKEHGE